MAFVSHDRKWLCLGAACFGLTAASAWLLQATGVPVLWPAAGLLIAWFGANPKECDWRPLTSCWLGGVPALLPFGWNFADAAVMMALTVCEAYLARWGLKKLRNDGSDWFERLDGFLLFVAATLCVAATMAIPAAWVAGPLTQIGGVHLWLGWMVATCLGSLTVTPIAWLVYSGRLRQEWRTTPCRSRISTYLGLFGVGIV